MNTENIRDLTAELLSIALPKKRGGAIYFNDRAKEIVKTISDYSKTTDLFRRNKEKGEAEIPEDATADQLLGYLCDRIVQAPTEFHRNASIVLLMPFIARALGLEETA